jgi:hypothetical protein
LSCRYNEFAGWLYQDAGDPDTAMMFSDRAMERALALDDSTKYGLPADAQDQHRHRPGEA